MLITRPRCRCWLRAEWFSGDARCFDRRRRALRSVNSSRRERKSSRRGGRGRGPTKLHGCFWDDIAIRHRPTQLGADDRLWKKSIYPTFYDSFCSFRPRRVSRVDARARARARGTNWGRGRWKVWWAGTLRRIMLNNCWYGWSFVILRSGFDTKFVSDNSLTKLEFLYRVVLVGKIVEIVFY